MDYTEKTVTFLEKRILRFTWSISGKMEDSIVKSEISVKVLFCSRAAVFNYGIIT